MRTTPAPLPFYSSSAHYSSTWRSFVVLAAAMRSAFSRKACGLKKATAKAANIVDVRLHPITLRFSVEAYEKHFTMEQFGEYASFNKFFGFVATYQVLISFLVPLLLTSLFAAFSSEAATAGHYAALFTNRSTGAILINGAHFCAVAVLINVMMLRSHDIVSSHRLGMWLHVGNSTFFTAWLLTFVADLDVRLRPILLGSSV